MARTSLWNRSRCATSAKFAKTSPRSARERAEVEDTEGGRRWGVTGIFKKLALSRHRRFPGDRVAVWSVVWLKASRQIKYRNCRSSVHEPGLAGRQAAIPSQGRGSLRIYWTEDEKGNDRWWKAARGRVKGTNSGINWRENITVICLPIVRRITADFSPLVCARIISSPERGRWYVSRTLFQCRCSQIEYSSRRDISRFNTPGFHVVEQSNVIEFLDDFFMKSLNYEILNLNLNYIIKLFKLLWIMSITDN